ncbi:MAG: hypothetical protein MMC33_004191 [Icmadophila ericetorum]|nr:hypothetical protein [Icmadophila ericetorum]
MESMKHFDVNNEDDEPPTPPPKDIPGTPASAKSVDAFFNPAGFPRAGSIYSIGRLSLTSQLQQLTSLHLPDATSLSSSISALSKATDAAKILTAAALQIQQWVKKASEVLGGLDAEDDVEWAAAGGREGLAEVDAAITKFEILINAYVTAIEELQERPDIVDVPTDDLKTVVDEVEKTLNEWEKIKKLLNEVKLQVEVAMEWEELWNTILGDIGMEMDNLGNFVFEMEEKRHRTASAIAPADIHDLGTVIDLQELETIVEESPMSAGVVNKASHRFSLPPAFPISSPIQAPHIAPPQEDSNLLALFARMQPLRASLDFLPMRLSTFQQRAKDLLPTACEELESRRRSLEKKWTALEVDAESLRRELSEDRWISTFRNAGRQAQKMCESVERSITKLQEAIDTGSQHSSPAALAKKVESYEAKKTHYGPAIQRVLSIIEKGVNDRLTVNGEILRLHADTKALWLAIEAEIKNMDIALEDMNMNKNQQLRDSISTIVSMDRSITSSNTDTPISSPASSVVMGPSNGTHAEYTTPYANGSKRRESSATRPLTARRNFTTPSGPRASGHSPRGSSATRAVSTPSTLREQSPYRNGKGLSATPTPTPGGRPQRPTMPCVDNRPRWNSSPKVDYSTMPPYGSQLRTPSPYKNIYRSSRSFSSTSHITLPSPLGRESSVSPAPSSPSMVSHSRSRAPSGLGIHNILPARTRRHTSPSPARSSQDSNEQPSQTRLHSSNSPQKPKLTSAAFSSSSKRQSLNPTFSLPEPMPDDTEPAKEVIPTPRPRPSRPATALAAGRRISMLPQAMSRPSSGRESVAGIRGGRESVAGTRPGLLARDTASRAGRRESSIGGSTEDFARKWK